MMEIVPHDGVKEVASGDCTTHPESALLGEA